MANEDLGQIGVTGGGCVNKSVAFWRIFVYVLTDDLSYWTLIFIRTFARSHMQVIQVIIVSLDYYFQCTDLKNNTAPYISNET